MSFRIFIFIFAQIFVLMLKFKSFGSGSSGNCYYLSNGEDALLIDAGVGIRALKRYFKEAQLKFDNVRGVLITHDHADHIKAVAHLANDYRIPVYTTTKIHEGIRKSYCVTEKIEAEYVKLLEKEQETEIGCFSVCSFEVPHDGTDNVGYRIRTEGKTFCVLTDIGHITPTAEQMIKDANYLVLESNYDNSMLEMGPYPAYLKERIGGENGHLCNTDAAKALAENYHEGLSHVWLCHLSEENNHPTIVEKCIGAHLYEIGLIVGKDINIEVLRRKVPSDMYEL